MQKHNSQIQKVSTLLQEHQSEMALYDLKKKQKQEIQVSIQQQYQAGVQALLSRYKGESRNINDPQVQQEMRQQ